MRSIRSLAGSLTVICAGFILISANAAAQGPISAMPVLNASQSGGATTIGPDGTYYALVPGTGSTVSSPVTELVAVGVAATPATKWMVNLTGNIGPVLPGASTVFVEQTTISGTGRMATATVSILTLSAATGTQGTAITPPAGNISDIEVRTINGADYLYVHTVATSSSSSNGTTTFTTTRTLTIYSQTGAVIKSVTL